MENPPESPSPAGFMNKLILLISVLTGNLASADVVLYPSPPNITSGDIRVEKGQLVGISLQNTDPRFYYGVFIYESGDCKNPVGLIDASKIDVERKWIHPKHPTAKPNGSFIFGYYDPKSSIIFEGHNKEIDDFVFSLKLPNKVFVLQVIDNVGKPYGQVACGIHP